MTRRLYRCLLRLHPSKFRDRYAEEMLWIFDESRSKRETPRLLLDAAASLLRQWTLRPEGQEPPRQARIDDIPSFGAYNRRAPAKHILACGAICSLLIFAVMGAVISRGGRLSALHIPQASGATGLPISFLALAPIPQATAPDEPGSISGRIVNAATGNPIPNIQVFLSGSGNTSRATTNDDGRYSFDGAEPGRVTVRVFPFLDHRFRGSRNVTLKPGERLSSVDLVMHPNPSIAGRVLDENDEPVPNVEVAAIGTEWFMGELRFFLQDLARTNDQGEYRLEQTLTPGTGVLLWARPLNFRMQPVSDIPADLESRRPTLAQTFHPSALQALEATPITLKPGEQRENIDIRMVPAPSLCAHTTLQLGPPQQEVSFRIQRLEPTLRPRSTGSVISGGLPPGGRLGPDGILRVCDLTRGEYALSVYTGNLNNPDELGLTVFNVTDEDINDLQLTVQLRVPLTGRVGWAGEPPPEETEVRMVMTLSSLQHIFGSGGRGEASVPGEFEIFGGRTSTNEPRPPVMGEYALAVHGLPKNVYVVDATYGGRSVLRRPLPLGAGRQGTELLLTLGHNGGSVNAHVIDAEGQPVSDATVVIIPKRAATHASLADERTAGQTDQDGYFSSPALVPGEYFVLAIDGDFTDRTPATVATLFDARSRAEEVNIGPNATVEIELEARRLPR